MVLIEFWATVKQKKTIFMGPLHSDNNAIYPTLLICLKVALNCNCVLKFSLILFLEEQNVG